MSPEPSPSGLPNLYRVFVVSEFQKVYKEVGGQTAADVHTMGHQRTQR